MMAFGSFPTLIMALPFMPLLLPAAITEGYASMIVKILTGL